MPHATAATSAAPASSRPSSTHPRTAAALLPPSGTTYAPSASAARSTDARVSGSDLRRYTDRATKCSRMPSAAHRASDGLSRPARELLAAHHAHRA
ncbi:hypothetical protein STENM223S_04737 [Streptomyces tendae]